MKRWTASASIMTSASVARCAFRPVPSEPWGGIRSAAVFSNAICVTEILNASASATQRLSTTWKPASLARIACGRQPEIIPEQRDAICDNPTGDYRIVSALRAATRGAFHSRIAPLEVIYKLPLTSSPVGASHQSPKGWSSSHAKT